MSESVRTKEARLRRAAERRGLRLIKRRRFDPKAFDYGLYVLVEDQANAKQIADTMFQNRQGKTLDEIEQQLS